MSYLFSNISINRNCMKIILLFLILCVTWFTAPAQVEGLSRKSKFVSVKDFVVLAKEQKESKSDPESWLGKGGLGPSNRKELKFTDNGLSINIKSTAQELSYAGIPNPVFFSKEKENMVNNSIDFKITADFTLITSKRQAGMGITCSFLRADLTPDQDREYLTTNILNFIVSKSGHFDILYSKVNLGEGVSLIDFTKVPFPEEPHQVSIERYGPYCVFSINGQVVKKVEMPNANFIKSADVLLSYEYSGFKGSIQKFTYEIFDMDYVGCISGTCQDGTSIKRIEHLAENAFISGTFANGHLPKGTYYYPKGGYYVGALVDDVPPRK